MPPSGPWTLGDYTTAGAALTKKVLMYGCVEAAGASGRRLGGCLSRFRSLGPRRNRMRQAHVPSGSRDV